MVPEKIIAPETQDPLAPLADEFIQLCRSDRNTTVEDFAQRYPEQADRIRRLFPSLLLVEKLSPGSSLSNSESQDEIRFTGAQIGEYNIQGELGRGGMGFVYRAVHRSLGREVALKVLNQRGLRGQGSLERFKLEARSAARLHHPHIVPVFDVGQDGDTWFYTMQLIQGQGLDRVLENMRLAQDSLPPRPAELKLPKPETGHCDETQPVMSPESSGENHEPTSKAAGKSQRLDAATI